jgi:hypothetical protein
MTHSEVSNCVFDKTQERDYFVLKNYITQPNIFVVNL